MRPDPSPIDHELLATAQQLLSQLDDENFRAIRHADPEVVARLPQTLEWCEAGLGVIGELSRAVLLTYEDSALLKHLSIARGGLEVARAKAEATGDWHHDVTWQPVSLALQAIAGAALRFGHRPFGNALQNTASRLAGLYASMADLYARALALQAVPATAADTTATTTTATRPNPYHVAQLRRRGR